MSEFSDRPFVAGSLIGLRSFRIDKYGRLTGAVYREPWRPGENVATCRKGALREVFYEPERAAKPVHEAGKVDCDCGYYAYFDQGSNRWHAKGQALAVVEGYGITTVGSRGFRAQKARIVGLIDDRRLSQRVTVRGWIFVALAVLNIWMLITFAVAADLQGTLTVGGCYAFYLLTSIGFRKTSPLIRRRLSSIPDRVAELYPVPIYRSVKAALAAHPLTPPPAPSPDTDPEFWTRRAS